ncbi:MAG: hypothetical protein E7464_01800 [Ruminococcaceae bacterium]|nr:hypothetical protein [Oscillospiraceae bacterium]
MQTAMDLRTALLEQGCSFTAEIQAHLPEGTAEFTLQCACAPDGTTTLEVSTPDTIAGISATVQPDGENISFDDVALEFGLLADGQVAPMVLPQLLFSCWTGGYIREAGADKELLSAVYLSGYGDRELAVEQWFTSEGIPTGADFWFGVDNIASVAISDFNLGTN